MIISSKDNEIVKEIRKLKEKKYRKDKFIVEGIKMLEEAINENASIDLIVIREGIDLKGTISNLFEGNEIRSIWNSDKEDYYISVIDVIRVLTDSNIPRNYWSDLKRKLKNEGSQLHENIVQLRMYSKKDGKKYLTDTLDTKGILRLIESIPSLKVEPFKLYLFSLESKWKRHWRRYVHFDK